MNRLAFRSLAISVVALALAVPAFAQRTAGPNAGVLGTTDPVDSRQALTFRGALFGAWDDTITDSSSEISDSGLDDRFLRSGLAGGAQGGLTHSRRTERTQWLSSADSTLRIYGSDEDAFAATFGGQTALTANLSSRASLSLTGAFSYSPYYELAPSYGTQARSLGSFGGGFGVATAAERNFATSGFAALSVRLSRRGTFELSGTAGHHNFLEQADSTVTSYGARARYRHSLTGALGVYAGFGREEGRYDFADADDASRDTIDVGIDYGDTLEFSRRTALSFGMSTSAVQWREETHWRLHGSVVLTRAVGRTGSAMVQYQRSTEYAGGFREPLLTDTFSGGFSDQIGRDTSWTVRGGYVRGEIGFESSSRRFDVYDAGARVTRALTRHLGIFGDYTYYRYEVPAGATVFTFLPKFSRQSVSFGLNLWAPLINDTRPPRERPVK